MRETYQQYLKRINYCPERMTEAEWTAKEKAFARYVREGNVYTVFQMAQPFTVRFSPGAEPSDLPKGK